MIEQSLQMMKTIIIFLHTFVGWALCGAIVIIGRELTSIETTLILHAIGAPIIFAVISLIYFKKFNYTTPMQSAIVFVSLVISMDFFIVALFIERSFEMFASLIGTWIPFLLIFISTYITGVYTRKRIRAAQS
jgi:hypothetical protein